MEQPIIEVNQVSKRYRLGGIGAGSLREEIVGAWKKLRKSSNENAVRRNHFYALDEVSFAVQPGEIIGIIGRNGAGKSTLLKILSRITEPTSGEAILRGKVASLLEVGTGFHPELSGRENIYLSGAVLGMSRLEIQKKFDEIVDFSEIGEFIETPVKRYSSGMAVRLGFAIAVNLDADILIVDEVLAVGDSRFQIKCINKIREVQRDGRTIIFVSHNSAAIESLCTRAILIHNGKVINNGPPNVILRQYLQSDAQTVDGKIIINDGCLVIDHFVANYQFISKSKCHIEFTITLKTNKPPPSFFIDLNISNRNNVRILQLVSLPYGYVVKCDHRDLVSVTYRLDCAPLRPGDYMATVYAYHQELGPLLHIEEIEAFSVIAQEEFPECRSSSFEALLTVPFNFMQNETTNS